MALYNQKLKNFDWAILPVHEIATEKTESCYHLYPLRINGITELQRDEIMQHIFNKDVSVNVHFIPLPMLSFYKNQGYNIKNYPNTYAHFANEITLPVFYNLTDEQIEEITTAVIESVQAVINN